MKPQVSGALLEEYKALREEILVHIRLERQIAALAGALYLGLLTFLTQLDRGINHDLIGISLVLVLVPIFAAFRYETFSIGKIASYIEMCIETRAEHLNWTGWHIKAAAKVRNVKSNRSLGWLIQRFDYHIAAALYFSILLVAAWGLPVYLKGSFYSLYPTLIMSVLTIVFIYNLVELLRCASHRKTWVRTWQELLNEAPPDQSD